MSKETLEAAGASAQLAAKISTQETVLKIWNKATPTTL